LRQYFAVSISQSEGRNKRNFNRKLDGIIASLDDELLASELDRTRSFIGALMGLYWPDSLFEQLDPQGRYDNTFIGLINLIQAESTLQPLILQFEDAQWLDEDSQKLLAQLERTIKSDESKSYPVAIIATARLEFTDSGLGEGLLYHEIRLGELPPDSLELIADQLLEGSASPELLELLLERADGNPFFAEQILHYLREEGLLKRVDTEWMVTDHYLTPLPDNVRALLVSRLDRLTQVVKQVVLTAAVLGREFDLRLLSHMLDGDTALPDKVAAAEQNAIWSAVNELRYLFNQALLHDAAYRMQVRSHRQELHKLAVIAIEGLYPKDLSSQSADLAYHCERAGLVDKARGHLIEAANAAKSVYHNAQAAEHLDRALNLTQDEDNQTRYKIILEREGLYKSLGKHEERLQDLEDLTLLLGSSRDVFTDFEKNKYSSKVAIRWANYKSDVGDFTGAIESTQEVISIADQTSITEDVVDAYFFWSLILYRQGNYDVAAKKGVEGLSHASKNGDRDGESRLLNLLGMIALEQENLPEAQDYYKRSLRIAKEIGNLRNQAMPLNNLGNEALTEGNFSAAQEYYERSLKLARKIGDQAGEGLVLGNLGYIAGIQGDFITGREYNDRSLQSARQVGNRFQEAYALINVSSILRALKEYPKALTQANQGLSITREIGDPNGEAWSLTSLGKIYFESGDLKDASEAFQAALHIRQSLDQPNLASELRAGQARIALEVGDLQKALTFVNPILSYLDQGGSLEGTEEPIRVYLTCFEVLQQIEDTRAEGILETAYSQLQVRGAGIKDEAMRQNYFENIPHHLQVISAWQAHHK
jgi:predicted ATPase